MLYRKYRPQKFSEIVGQEHVVRTLQGALEKGRVGHAYLFTGPRGTGKTSLARLFAKVLNCTANGKWQMVNDKYEIEPCNECDMCLTANQGNLLDIIEIDAASRTGVNDIREVIDSAMFAAPGGGYKVFLIDEVHMLSKPAFNALLKILEEPPKHVIFILATTEVHKIIPTVLSRVQRFDFKRLNKRQIFDKLKMVAGKEDIKIEDEAVKTIAMSADGALRDAEVALSKIQASVDSSKIVTSDDVNEILGLAPYRYYPEFVNCLLNSNRAGAMDLIHKTYLSGADLDNFTSNLIEYVRGMLMVKINPAIVASTGNMSDEEIKSISEANQNTDSRRLINIMLSFSKARNEIKHSPVPQLPLELAVIDMTEKI